MNILITSGGTSEKIDEVRTITNISTGELGVKIADKILKEMFDVSIYFLSSNLCKQPNKNPKLKIIEITDTQSVLHNMKNIIENNKIDYVVHAMAISDYTTDKVFDKDNLTRVLDSCLFNKKTKNYSTEQIANYIINNIKGIDNSKKISSSNDIMFVQLKKTPKIVDIIKQWDKDIKLISFKLLNGVSEEELFEVAKKQLERTDSSLVVANDLVNIKNKNHRALFVKRDGYDIFEGKSEIANEIFNFINRV